MVTNQIDYFNIEEPHIGNRLLWLRLPVDCRPHIEEPTVVDRKPRSPNIKTQAN